MVPRVGIVALQHESNTFIPRTTSLADFEGHLLLEGEAVRERLADSHHEVGGFFGGLAAAGVEAVPVFAARALPYGTIEHDAAMSLVERLLRAVDGAGRLDGLLVAPHGAAVSERERDFDGYWLTRLRERFGPSIPIIGTLDLHTNLSPKMVAACDALIAYRTNPHLDQRARGEEAASLMVRTLRGEVRPTMAAAFPPLCVNIERQATAEPHWKPLLELAERQRHQPGVLSNSLVYGFPYADVREMGAATIAVTNGDQARAQTLADELSDLWWNRRKDFVGKLVDIGTAIERVAHSLGPICLLDMGDNVGGGSPGDGTVLAHALHTRQISKSLICLADPEAVVAATATGLWNRVQLAVGGKTDDRHAAPFRAEFTVRGLYDGKFREPAPRHGGIVDFDQGPTAVVVSSTGSTVMLTTRRMAPFSLNQLTSCGLDPTRFRVLVAKGVHAPVAAYGPVCKELIRVDTPGVTAANLDRFEYHHRRRPMFPFDDGAQRG